MANIAGILGGAFRGPAIGACAFLLAMPCVATPFSVVANALPDLTAFASRLGDVDLIGIESADGLAPLQTVTPTHVELGETVVAARGGMGMLDRSDTPIDPSLALQWKIALERGSLPPDGPPLPTRRDPRDDSVGDVDDFAAGRLAESFEVLLGNEFLVSQPLVHSVVPVLSTTQTSGGARAAPQSPARDAALDFGWRETVFGIIRWTFSTLAVLALAGVALVFAVPGLRRRLLYPDLPSLPAPAAAIAVGK